MKVKQSGAKFSSIVKIGQELPRDFLPLHRGVNNVCTLDIQKVIDGEWIHFNEKYMQNYPPNSGSETLRKQINRVYFDDKAKLEDIFITNGGMSSLDLIMKTLDVDEISIPEFHWGAYKHIATINGIKTVPYGEDFADAKGVVIICYPSNPTGVDVDDDTLLKQIKVLSWGGNTVIFDCPYRKLFTDDSDTFYQELRNIEGVIITESFSKSMGIPGQRVCFVHCTNQKFNKEFAINLLYANNGINVFGQELVACLLGTGEGMTALNNFKRITRESIETNIKALKGAGWLYEDFYKGRTPKGIFAVVNKTPEELKEYKMGAVPLSFFHHSSEEFPASRLCVSYPYGEFLKHMTKAF